MNRLWRGIVWRTKAFVSLARWACQGLPKCEPFGLSRWTTARIAWKSFRVDEEWRQAKRRKAVERYESQL